MNLDNQLRLRHVRTFLEIARAESVSLAAGRLNITQPAVSRSLRELEDILGIRQPTLSQQLSRLRSENVVVTRRESKQIYYRIASDEVIELIGLMYDLFCNKEMDASATAEVSANVA